MPTPEAAAARALVVEQLKSEQQVLTIRLKLINRVAVVIVGAFALLIAIALLVGFSNGHRVQEQANHNSANATVIAGLVLQVAQAQAQLKAESCVAYRSAVHQTALIFYDIFDSFPPSADVDKIRATVAARAEATECPITNPDVVVPPSLAGATAPTTVAGPLG